MLSVCQDEGHCLRAGLEQQLRPSPSASYCCAPLHNSILLLKIMLAEVQAADTVLLA